MKKTTVDKTDVKKKRGDAVGTFRKAAPFQRPSRTIPSLHREQIEERTDLDR